MPLMPALWLCQCAQTSAAVLLAGTAVLRLLTWGTGTGRPRGFRWLAWGSWAVMLGAAVLQLGLTAASMSGLPLAQAWALPVLGRVLAATRFGAVWKVRFCLLAGMGVVGQSAEELHPPHAARSRTSAGREITGAMLAAGLLGTLVWSGHAGASDRRVWLLPVDLLHALAAGVWPGGLLPLVLLLARAHGEPGMVLPTTTVVRRFSRLSMAAVGVLAFSGLLNSAGLVGTVAALWPSTYGRLILCKVTILTAMVALGAANRRMLRRDDFEDTPRVLRSLRRNVAWETGLAVLVLLATEALAINSPPASATPHP